MFELLFAHPLWAYRAGKLTFAGVWPLWALLVAIVLACALIAVSLWQRRHLGWPRLAVLGALQIALAALVLCLLWRPSLNVERVRDRQNVLAIVLDNSTSMQQRDAKDEHAPSRLQLAIDALKRGPLADLGKIFELRFFAFDKSTAPIANLDSLPQSGNQTRIGDALRNVMQTAGSVPMAGVLLVSDGAETGHSLSEANLRELASFGVPIHTLGVGAESIDNDLELEAIQAPSDAAPNTTVTAEAIIQYTQAANTRLRVYDGDKLLAAREIKLQAQGSREAGPGYITALRVEFPSGAAGVRDLRFTLDALPNERNTINNTRHHVLNVPDARRSILYIDGEPRWEFKFIRRAVEGERSLRFTSVVRTTQNKFYRQGVASSDELAEGFPTTAKELFAYDAVIVGSYEALSLTATQQQLLKDFVDKRGGGVMLLAGRYGLADGGWGSSPLAETLPTHLNVKRGHEFVQTPVKAALTSYGAESTAMRFDADPKKNAELWQSLPELANYQALGALKPGAVVLLETAKTHDPLLVWQRFGRGSTFEFGTASTQRWQMLLPLDDQRHEIFWRQLLHAIADQAPSVATLTTDRAVYDDERGVQLNAQIRDSNFEPTSTAQVEALVTSDHGDSFVRSFAPVPDSKGRFTAALDANEPGLYRVDLTAKVGKDQVFSANTAFRREDNVVENFASYQHRAVLERLASETHGRYWGLDELSSLTQAIPYAKSGIVERQVFDLWNIPFVFLLLLALKMSEWLLRLKWGTL